MCRSLFECMVRFYKHSLKFNVIDLLGLYIRLISYWLDMWLNIYMYVTDLTCDWIYIYICDWLDMWLNIYIYVWLTWHVTEYIYVTDSTCDWIYIYMWLTRHVTEYICDWLDMWLNIYVTDMWLNIYMWLTRHVTEYICDWLEMWLIKPTYESYVIDFISKWV